ncbi:MAG: alpha/beta family hydrolase [Phenylobacterium sp.]|uniref:alpha/beta hydrolase family protein n=1 Tax=Phenylobacterium sp. TaxID=1871053 RepID=UPI002A3616B5|nr:alpha/beta family hydrolase [Phenylobacterium sp.]MDX9999435.1 dienelactone hydrolase family protein [Phenylobacterium sp.]
MAAEPFTLAIPGQGEVAALWQALAKPWAVLSLAHGAGAGMDHRSMAALADGLEARGIATLRFQFPYMQRGSKRVDPPPIAQAALRAAAAEAARRAADLPLFAGGRSFGGRMTSQAQAAEPLAGVRGLVFFAFPLHLAGKPSTERAAHLGEVATPMLFLQGDNDALARLDLLRETVERLSPSANLHLLAHADHSFHAPARSGRKDSEVLTEALDAAAAWMRSL